MAEALPAAARYTLGSVFITNIGNGMNTLAVGKLLFDHTGSAAAFGAVLSAEYVITFIVQIFAGPIADRFQPKTVVGLTDATRGMCVLAASVMLGLSYNMFGSVLISVLAVNIGKPFYRSATFSIGPSITTGPQLVRYNAYYDGMQQGGQLLGLALVGIVIERFGAIVPFALNGVSFLAAAALIVRAPLPELARTVRGDGLGSVVADWKEVIQRIRAEWSLGVHIVLAGVDFLAVSLVAMLVIPVVKDWYGGSPYWMSAFTGAFAVGAVLGAAVVSGLIARMTPHAAAVAGLFGQGLCFLLLGVVRGPFVSVGIIVAMGVFNALSFTSFTTTLQQRSDGPIKGRIVAARTLTTGALAAVLIPLVSHAQALSTAYALETAAVVLAAFALATAAFGRSLLGREVPASR